ncbi:MAG: lipoyl synthase [Candidatus Omnitrophota bacterium]
MTTHKRPQWLNKRISLKECKELKGMFKDLGLNTVCEEAHCPNISECFSKRTATFMILGDICTRNCAFCAIKKGDPLPPDHNEPERIAQAVKNLDLKYVVITSVTRDDLSDGGAELFAMTVTAIRNCIQSAKIELLTPDFKGDFEPLKKIVDSMPDVVNHNIETVPRLYKEVRSQSDYRRSISILRIAKEISGEKNIYTKSGLMVGMGEGAEEVLELFEDLRNAGCDFLSIGQYLSPGPGHYPVKEYVSPDRFSYYKNEALKIGFLHVESGPYVRSSYCASEYFDSL